MRYPLKLKSLNIIGLLSLSIGVLIVVGWIFQIPFFRAILPANISMMVSLVFGWVILACASLAAQFQVRKYNAVLKTLNDQLVKRAEKSSAQSNFLLEKLKNCKENYQSVIKGSFDAIYVVDFDGKFIDANSSMCEMTGYSRDELLKLHISQIIDPEQLKTDPFTPFSYDYGRPLVKERRFVTKSGKMINVKVNIRKFAENRVMAIAHDITARKQLEIELHQAELKFRALAEKSNTGVYVLQNEKIVYINQRFAEVFGYEPYELINTPNSFIDIIISKECRAIVRTNLRERYSGKIDYLNYEVTGIKKDGTFNHIEFSGGRAIIDGEPTIIGTMIDITDRWKNEEVLKQYEANLQTIMDSADTAYALFDKNLKATAFNEMGAKFSMTQYNHKLKIGGDLKDYFQADRLPQYAHAVNEVLEGNIVCHEINYAQPDGSAKWYFARLLPISNQQKETLGLMLALSDITDRKIAEGNLHAAYDKIQQHLNGIREMAWKQSHLIRSPLANLKGLVGLLQDDPSDKETLKNIRIELERLDAVIIDLAEDASNHDL